MRLSRKQRESPARNRGPGQTEGMARQNWFDAVGEEHRQVRAHAGLFDQSSFAKYELSGPGAAEALEAICANRVARDAGRLTYTQLLNSRGGIEADLTVARLAEDWFYIVTGTGFRTHDFGWIADHLPATGTSFPVGRPARARDDPARRAAGGPPHLGRLRLCPQPRRRDGGLADQGPLQPDHRRR